MSDFKFSPDQLDVNAGQTVRLVVSNQGATNYSMGGSVA